MARLAEKFLPRPAPFGRDLRQEQAAALAPFDDESVPADDNWRRILSGSMCSSGPSTETSSRPRAARRPRAGETRILARRIGRAAHDLARQARRRTRASRGSRAVRRATSTSRTRPTPVATRTRAPPGRRRLAHTLPRRPRAPGRQARADRDQLELASRRPNRRSRSPRRGSRRRRCCHRTLRPSARTAARGHRARPRRARRQHHRNRRTAAAGDEAAALVLGIALEHARAGARDRRRRSHRTPPHRASPRSPRRSSATGRCWPRAAPGATRKASASAPRQRLDRARVWHPISSGTIGNPGSSRAEKRQLHLERMLTRVSGRHAARTMSALAAIAAATPRRSAPDRTGVANAPAG